MTDQTLGYGARHGLEDRYADNGGIRIHYVATGEGPLAVMLHGFPDYWASWRGLIDAMKGGWRVAALDMRGYNLSDKPQGAAAYALPVLLSDVEAVIAAEGRSRAVLIAHDWGGAVAWGAAALRPAMVERLIVLSTPHPVGMSRELAANPAQQAAGAYAHAFQQPGSESTLTAEALADLCHPLDRDEYLAAMRRSDFAAMMNYYRAGYPAKGAAPLPTGALPTIQAPTLVIHGLDDPALVPAGHAGTWDRVAADTTVLMIPKASHWVHHDAAPLVERTILDWLTARPSTPEIGTQPAPPG